MTNPGETACDVDTTNSLLIYSSGLGINSFLLFQWIKDNKLVVR